VLKEAGCTGEDFARLRDRGIVAG